jgi:hypothetical protein
MCRLGLYSHQLGPIQVFSNTHLEVSFWHLSSGCGRDPKSDINLYLAP